MNEVDLSEVLDAKAYILAYSKLSGLAQHEARSNLTWSSFGSELLTVRTPQMSFKGKNPPN